MEDRIEQRITIRSSQDKVWQLVTRPGWWLPGSKAEPGPRPGTAAGRVRRRQPALRDRRRPGGTAGLRLVPLGERVRRRGPRARQRDPGRVLPAGGRRRGRRDRGGERLRLAQPVGRAAGGRVEGEHRRLAVRARGSADPGRARHDDRPGPGIRRARRSAPSRAAGAARGRAGHLRRGAGGPAAGLPPGGRPAPGGARGVRAG